MSLNFYNSPTETQRRDAIPTGVALRFFPENQTSDFHVHVGEQMPEATPEILSEEIKATVNEKQYFIYRE